MPNWNKPTQYKLRALPVPSHNCEETHWCREGMESAQGDTESEGPRLFLLRVSP